VIYSELQKEAPENVKYKVLFCGRHGQGWHNYGAEQYDPVVSIMGRRGLKKGSEAYLILELGI
jgi:hypothetical protein